MAPTPIDNPFANTADANMSTARLAKLRRVAADTNTSFIAGAGADTQNDVGSRGLLEYALPPYVAADNETLLLITPKTIQIHCNLSAWAGALQPVLDAGGYDADSIPASDEPSLSELHAHVPSPQWSEEATLDFKLEVTRTMLEAASRDATSVLAGGAPLSTAVKKWPLLRAVNLHLGGASAVPSWDAAMAPVDEPDNKGAKGLALAMRSIDMAALQPNGWAGLAISSVCAGFGALSNKMCSLHDAYDRGEISEKGLTDIAHKASLGRCTAASADNSPPEGAEALLGSGISGVWAGIRSSKCGQEASKKRPIRMSGPGSTPALHMVARFIDPSGTGVGVGRTIFLSNGRAPHHWQHRVFSDGEVFDPIVEDDVPEVDRSDETLRLITLYGILTKAVSDAAATTAIPSSSPTQESLTEALIARLTEARDEHGLLPKNFDLKSNATMTVTRVLAPRAGGATDEEEEAKAIESVPSHWCLHRISARLENVPSIRWKPDAEGCILFEETYSIDGRGGYTTLTEGVPLLSCWPAEGAEESESRQVRGAVESNAVCTKLDQMVERLRAGEHHVLQALAVEPQEDVVVLTSNPWLPIIRGDLRLFTGGIAIDTGQHGPHTLPFRFHLAAMATQNLHHPTQPALILLRQKPDSHGYGPIALLPTNPGDATPVEKDPDTNEPPMRTLSLAIVVPPRSTLAKGLDLILPIWRQLCSDCKVPLDEIPMPPAEFIKPLDVLSRAEAAGLGMQAKETGVIV